MPTPLLINLAERRNINLKKVEDYWEKAKKIALKTFQKKDPAYWPYVVGITKKMCGVSESATSNLNLKVPRRVQYGVNRQIYKIIKPLFKNITSGQSLPKGMACHSKCFKYLMEQGSPTSQLVMLYRYNQVNAQASLLAHSVVCDNDHIVYDPNRSQATEIVNDTYYDSRTDSILYVAVRLNLDTIETLIEE